MARYPLVVAVDTACSLLTVVGLLLVTAPTAVVSPPVDPVVAALGSAARPVNDLGAMVGDASVVGVGEARHVHPVRHGDPAGGHGPRKYAGG